MPRKGLIGLALLVAFVLLVWLALVPREPVEETPRNLVDRSSLNKTDSPKAIPLPKLNLGATEVGKEIPPAGKDEIQGERVLVFGDKDAYLRAIDLLESAGLRILSRSDALKALRVQGIPSDWSQLGLGATEEFNTIVRTPGALVSNFLTLGPLVPVEGNLLRSLGLDLEAELPTGQGVRIAVLDTGVGLHSGMREDQVKHWDLLPNASKTGSALVHGTAVAGLILSTDSIAPGLATGAELLDIRVLDSEGVGDAFTVAEGIVTAVEAGAKIINMSLGTWGTSGVLESAVQYALDNGVLIVAAVGNDGRTQLPYPAAYDGVLAVGAVDAVGNAAPFSNQGAEVDFAAPGVEIFTLGSDNQFLRFNGTSASVPIVTSIASWILEKEPNLSPQEVVAKLNVITNDQGAPGVDSVYGEGTLSAARFLEQNNPAYRNLGLFSQAKVASGGQILVEIGVENRGNQYEPSSEIVVRRNGSESRYRVPALQVNDTFSIEIPLIRGAQLAIGDLPLEFSLEPDDVSSEATLTDNKLLIQEVPTD